MRCFTTKIFCFLLLTLSVHMRSMAQTITFTPGSDYYVYAYWNNIPTASFSCFYDGCELYVGPTAGSAAYLNKNAPALPGGNVSIPIGPGITQTYVAQFYQHGRNTYLGLCANPDPGTNYINSTPQTISTSNIKDPGYNYQTLQTAPNLPLAEFPVLYWTKGSDIPDSNLVYNVYRDGTLIATVPPSTFGFEDTTLLATGTYTYVVKTKANKWGNPESNGLTFTVNITNDLLTATDATLYGKSKLTWPNLAPYAPNDINILRDGQQIAVVNKNTTTYNDFDGVPGVIYDYAIAPIDANNHSPFSFHDNGSARPNGVIKGNVRTPFNANVTGVTLYAYANVDSTLIADSTTTDASGFYQFNDLFYDTSAVYTIVPRKGTHHFNPDTLTRTLGLNNNVASGVDFQDTSVFTIQGQILFASDPNCLHCYDAGVEIFKDGVSTNVSTDATGKYSLAIQTEGLYTFKPKLFNHKFSPDSVVINVTGDSFNVNFTDLARDTIFLSVKGGCGNTVSYKDVLTINSVNQNYIATQTISGYGQSFIVVPAQAYSIGYLQGYANAVVPDPLLFTALGSTPIAVDATKRDSLTTTHIDTTYHTIPASTITLVSGQVIVVPAHTDTIIDTLTNKIELKHRADFVYHGQITVDVPNFPISTECPFVNNGYILDQGSTTPLRISISEFYPFDSTSCPVDSGQLVIYDDVSDINGAQTVTFYNGRYNYTVVPGSPNIAIPYTKVLQFFAHVGNVTNPTWGRQIIVTGHKPHTQTFVTKTPELPFFVLHDPPGDASYSFLSKDSSVSYNYSTSYQVGGSAGPYIDAKIGAGVPVPFTGIVIGAGSEIQADATAGRDNNHNTDVTTTFTASQQFSTSNSSNFVGGGGDVFVGGSFNMIYALTDVIELKNCIVVRDTQLAWGANGLATNYIYTERHIRETLIPQLQNLKALSHGDTIALIQSYIDVWNQVLSKNRRNRDTAATFIQNVSFSAGAPYDNSTTNTSDSTESYDYSVFLDINAGIGAFFGDLGGFANTTFGVKANFHWNTNNSSSTNVNLSKTIGYHLEDVNAGDFMSVDVKKDKFYGTPSFKIVAGTTSCPHEAGTQARDSADLSLASYSVSNVPLNQSANFVANIVNLSESQETRTYNVQAIPESNRDGAIIKIGGQQINNSPASFTVPAGTSLPVVLTVERGPVASDYNGLQVAVSSPCDGGEGNTITFEAHFQSTCSPIGLYAPSDNWLINAANHDSLVVIFSGYNANDSNLISIGLEYRQAGGVWLPANAPIARSQLVAPYYSFILNTASLPDGDYEIRAYANCGSQPGGRTNSATLHGKIDRSSLQLFGTPSPSDGVLNVTQNISVAFNGAVDCGQAATYTPIFSRLVRNDNGQVIPDSVTCNGNQLIIYTNPPSLIDSLENVSLTCTINNVYDMNGNSLQEPVIWSFIVNRSKVFWNPSNININALTGTTATATATMQNVGPLDTFTIIHIPSWLSTPQAAMYIVNPGTPANPSSLSVTFTAQNSLNPGHYTDTVIAKANGRKIFLFVNLDVVKPHPDWTVNPASYQYSMNITTNYSLTQLDLPLSSDTRDTIAVFKGNECRGYAGISYDAYTNRYVAFITAYSNSIVGDTFTFRMWDAVPGTEYQAKERLTFIDNGTIGQPLAPYILHPEGVFETKAFTPGWNWFSLYNRSSDMSVGKVLQSLHPDSSTIVKTDNSYAQYTVASGSRSWQGSLSTFTINKSYMMYLSHADTLHVLGQPVTDTTTMQIAAGWNWIGYPRQDISSALSYLRNTNVANGDLLKTQSTFTQYNGGNWSGTLNNMYPGQGYKLRATNAFNFAVPPSRRLPTWSTDASMFQQNMTVTADLQFEGVSANQSHFLVGAFANGVCVGVGQPLYISALNVYRVFLTVHGDSANAGQAISYKVYDTDNDVEYTPVYDLISVAPDSAVAKVGAPYVINVHYATGINALSVTEGYSLLQNVPNPFNQNTSIEYVIPTAQAVNITLYDESGRRIAELVSGTQVAGRHQVSFAQEDLQSGVYFYQMKSGEFTRTRRMLILK